MEALEQRHAALEKANETRFARAKLKREIATRRRNPVRVLKDPPEFAKGMAVEKVLASVPGLGENKVPRLLRNCQIPPSKTLGTLTERQRVVLARGIKEKAWLMP